MRRKLIALFMLLLFLIILRFPVHSIETIAKNVSTYYTTHFLEDTGASNAVTAIYLNYRVFDTIFEALLLLVSIIGIIHFSRHEGDIE